MDMAMGTANNMVMDTATEKKKKKQEKKIGPQTAKSNHKYSSSRMIWPGILTKLVEFQARFSPFATSLLKQYTFFSNEYMQFSEGETVEWEDDKCF